MPESHDPSTLLNERATVLRNVMARLAWPVILFAGTGIFLGSAVWLHQNERTAKMKLPPIVLPVINDQCANGLPPNVQIGNAGTPETFTVSYVRTDGQFIVKLYEVTDGQAQVTRQWNVSGQYCSIHPSAP